MPKKKLKRFLWISKVALPVLFQFIGYKPRANSLFCFPLCQKFMLGMPSPLFRQASMLRQIHLSPRTRQILQDFNFIFLIQALTIPLKIWSNKTTSRRNGSTTSAISREDQIANLAPEGPDPSTAWQPEGPDSIKWWDKKRQQNWDKVGRKYY